MVKRLFIAMPLPNDYLSKLSPYGDDYNVKGNRWTAPENLHITVSFLGGGDDLLLPKIIERLNGLAAEGKPFILKFNKIFFAPPGRVPNMIWAIFFASDDFSKLTQNIFNKLQDLIGVKPENKPIPHVTLARFKDYQLWGGIKLKQIKFPDLLVKEIHLFESKLKSDGPVYSKLAEFKLKKDESFS